MLRVSRREQGFFKNAALKRCKRLTYLWTWQDSGVLLPFWSFLLTVDQQAKEARAQIKEAECREEMLRAELDRANSDANDLVS